MMELEDLSEGKLAKTKIHENLESVVGKTDILLILDENDIKPEQSRVEVFFNLLMINNTIIYFSGLTNIENTSKIMAED